MKNRVLIIPDAFWGLDSGAVAARIAANVWLDVGCDVGVYVAGAPETGRVPDEIQAFSRPPYRGSNHLFGGGELSAFERILDTYRPSHVFFLGSAISKPAPFFRACRQRCIRTITFWWVQDFFCCRGYACLKNGPCQLCIDGNYLHAFRSKCSYRENFRSSRCLVHALSLARLKKELLLCDVMMGSSQSQLALYERYGVNREAIVQCPLFFDLERLSNLESKTGNYFVYYGQTRMEKGAHLLKEIMSKCSDDLKLIIPFNTDDTASEAIAKFDLGDMIKSGRIEIRTGLTWYEGAGKLVAESRGVLIPSIWPTTTEYVLLESLGLGKAVIAFDVGIHNDLITSGRNGLLAPLGDTETFALNMAKLACDDNVAAKLQAGARILFDEMTEHNRYRDAFLSALEKTKGICGK